VAAKHQKGGSEVALLDDRDGHDTFVIGINDDRPLLFDSAVAAAIAGGARLRAVLHPIIALDGAPTSVIVLVCEGLMGDARGQVESNLRDAFGQGALAVRDWQAMLARLKEARDGLAAQGPADTDSEEDIAFLDWLADNHFTFLGARDYVLAKDGANGRLDIVKGSGLGVLADDEARVIRANGERSGMNAEVRAWMDAPQPLIVTKSATRSHVHRRAHMDYIGVKTYDAQGRFIGERRFVGLFTSSAYSAQPRAIPMLRTKIARVMKRAGLAPASNDGNALTHILDTFPRD
jgi:glutamate dehydrogenase